MEEDRLVIAGKGFAGGAEPLAVAQLGSQEVAEDAVRSPDLERDQYSRSMDEVVAFRTADREWTDGGNKDRRATDPCRQHSAPDHQWAHGSSASS